MNALIPIISSTIDGAAVQTVNARDLHEFLEVTSRFNDWIANRIKDFDFVENQDFVTFTENLVSGGKRKEYALTLNMGKELSMVERNQRGKEARLYFLECERRAKDPLALLNDPAAMRSLLITYSEKVIERDKLIATIAPKAAALDKIALADGTLSLSDAAKTISVQPKKEFIPLLTAAKWIFRRAGGDHWIAYQDKIQQQLLEHKVTTVSRGDGTEKITEQVRVTPKGLTKLAQMFGAI